MIPQVNYISTNKVQWFLMSLVHEFVLCTIMQENTISGGVNKTQNIDCPLYRTVEKLLPNTRSGFHGTSDWLLKRSESQVPEN